MTKKITIIKEYCGTIFEQKQYCSTMRMNTITKKKQQSQLRPSVKK